MELYTSLFTINALILAVIIFFKMKKRDKEVALAVLITIVSIIILLFAHYAGTYLFNIDQVILNITNLLLLALALMTNLVYGFSLAILIIFPPEKYDNLYDRKEHN